MRTRLLLSLLLLCTLPIPGCQQGLSRQERDDIATVYAEMLIIRNQSFADSAEIRRAIDSILDEHGFADNDRFERRFNVLTENPDHLREVMDSVQRYLERVQHQGQTRMNTSP